MIIKVAPLRRMPLGLDVLDYLPPETEDKILIGQLIKIPFRNREIFGLVVDFSKNEPLKNGRAIKLKAISGVVFPTPLISPEQISFLKEISELYQTPLGQLLISNLLPLQPRKIKKIKLIDKEKTLDKKFVRPELLMYKNPEEQTKIFSEKISKDGQTLILIPEISASYKILQQLPSEFQARVSLIHSDLSIKEFFDKWLEIFNNQNKIIIGTRRALFLPWQNLQNIIMDDEGNENYKSWDMTPRFHTRDAALLLAKAHGAKLTFCSHTPSAETLYFSEHNVYGGEKLKNLPDINNSAINLVDLKEERRGGNYGFLSQELLNDIKNETNGDIFIFLNRLGSSTYVGCRDCGRVMRCEQCQRTLIYHQEENILRCHFCKKNYDFLQHCSNCKGVNLAMYGIGTELAENTIKKTVGQNRTVIRLDSETIKITPDLSTYTGQKIIIGTEIAWSKIDWKKIKLMIWLDADTALFTPEYRANENLWQLLRTSQFNLLPDAKIIIQTSHPEHPVFTNLNQPKKFYNQEWCSRQALKYPPFTYLIRLYGGTENQANSELEAAKVFRSLKVLTVSEKGVIIAGPLKMTPSFYQGKFWQVIIVKVPFERYKFFTKKLAKHTPSGWKFDPNPNNILTF